jgi:NAD(P)-dependent dehydrogenase (short-subunit alcohol dehydrogenase family)
VKKRILLITGGGRGIGAATARLAASRKYEVCLTYLRNRSAAEGVAAAINDAGGAAHVVQADVSIESDVVRLFERVDTECGRITALVNNAGMLETQMRVDEMDAARLTRVFAANVVGTMLCCREAVKRMSARYGGTGGVIVNLSSAAARLGSPGEYVDYAAAKAAIDTLTIGLSREVGAEGVRVNAVRPGLIDTEIHASGGEPERIARLAATVPMKRGGTAEEVAAAILWLLSDEASYVNGAILDVTGGR